MGIEEASDFDLEEFKALREEILQKVDSVSKLEQIAVGSVAAIYAWLATRELEPERWIWFIPVVFAALGWIWAKKIGHQIYLTGQYILVLERLLRRKAWDPEWIYDALPERLKRKVNPEKELSHVHGWEGFIRVHAIRNRFLDRVSHLFWFLFVVITFLFAVLRPLRHGSHDSSASPATTHEPTRP